MVATTPARAAVALGAVPLLGGVWMAVHGGGYTIDEWGPWAFATLVALAVAAWGGACRRLGRLELVLPGSLAALAAWALLSAAWAPYPQNALVEGVRYAFYAATVLLVLAVVPRPLLPRAVPAVVGAVAAAYAVGVAVFAWLGGGASADWFLGGRLVGSMLYGGGVAAAAAVAVWPLVAVAGDARTRLAVRAAAAGGAATAAALVIPTGARATFWGMLLGGLVYLVLARRLARSVIVGLAAAATMTLLWDTLNGAYETRGGDVGAAHATGAAVLAVGLAAAAAAIVAGVLERRLEPDSPVREHGEGIARAALGVAVAIAAVWTLVATGGRPLAALSSRVDEFRNDRALDQSGSRLFTLATDRYDLWRVASLAYRDRPVTGYGAANFSYAYQLDRQSRQQVVQAHSQVLEVLSTLGQPGLLLYLPAVGLPLGAAVFAARGRRADSEALAAAGLAGALTGFTVQTSVDWIWQIGADALPALVLAAAAVGSLGAAQRPLPRRPALAVAGTALAAAIVLALPATIAQRYLLRSYIADPATAVDYARRAGRFDVLSGRPEVAEARALLRAGRAGAAVPRARAAADAERDFWVAWQVLYMAASTAGDEAEAARALAEVKRLNPYLNPIQQGQIPDTDYDHY